jgi:hypothetical protein
VREDFIPCGAFYMYVNIPVHFVGAVSCVYEYFIYFNTISLTVHFLKDASPKKTTAVLHTQLACIQFDSLLKVGCMNCAWP